MTSRRRKGGGGRDRDRDRERGERGELQHSHSEQRLLGNGGDGGQQQQQQQQQQQIRFKCSFKNTIYDVLRSRKWVEAAGEDTAWDIMWAEREWVYDVFDNQHLESWQRLNHYRNGRELCRKDLLVKNLKKRRRQLEREGRYEEAAEYDFFPVTFVLPREYAMFVEEFKRHGGVWIMKPIGSAQGKGIFLFTRLSEISEWRTDSRYNPSKRDEASVEAYVVQKYIQNPLLIGGKKFDLRLYALVMSFSPLKVYQYRRGFARFTQTRYSSEPADIANAFMHLTNVAIQKQADNYDSRSGGKLELQALKTYLMSRYGVERVDALFWEIQMVIIRSLMAVQQAMIHDRHCFELYGYDVMIDENLKPWLIEVNASPSLTANTKDDYLLKCEMLHGVMDVVDMEQRLRGDEEHVSGYDLIYDNGYIEIDPSQCGYTTFLGSRVPRPSRSARNMKIPEGKFERKSGRHRSNSGASGSTSSRTTTTTTTTTAGVAASATGAGAEGAAAAADEGAVDVSASGGGGGLANVAGVGMPPPGGEAVAGGGGHMP